MGYYVNPPTTTKEEWLGSHGVEIYREITAADITEDQLPVCLVNNGPFTAAGVAYSPEELRAFQDPNDPRPKTWYLVSIKALLPVTDSGLAEAITQAQGGN